MITSLPLQRFRQFDISRARGFLWLFSDLPELCDLCSESPLLSCTSKRFCSRHAAQSDAQVIIDTDLSAALGDEPTDLRSAAPINDFLAKPTTLLIQNRISSRRASVLAYISSLELRTLAAIEHELGQDDFCPIILDNENPASAAATADKRS